ncbi:helix-turn-helix domain-containing protein [Nocardia aurea]|uniref:helix-turn-helix domain-containing protein n=1 Tax=Nocardia aurea TaxID=2144174 RepID=UPI0033A512FC
MPASSPPTRRVVEVVALLAERHDRPPRLNDVVNTLGLNQATAHAILAELTAVGWVSRDPIDKTYALGAELLRLVGSADRTRHTVHAAHAAAHAAATETGYAASVSERLKDTLVVRAFVPAAAPGLTLAAGDTIPFEAPFGPAYAAWEPEQERRDWLERSGITTATHRARMEQQLEATRDRGYSIEHLSPDMATAIPAMTRIQTGALSESVRTRIDEVILELTTSPGLGSPSNPAEKYYIGAIAAPLFDDHGRTAFNLCLHPFTTLPLPEVELLGSLLVRAVTAIEATTPDPADP